MVEGNQIDTRGGGGWIPIGESLDLSTFVGHYLSDLGTDLSAFLVVRGSVQLQHKIIMELNF